MLPVARGVLLDCRARAARCAGRVGATTEALAELQEQVQAVGSLASQTAAEMRTVKSQLFQVYIGKEEANGIMAVARARMATDGP